MKTILKIHTIAALLTGFAYLSFGQGIGINQNSAPADESAILDVSSTTKGMLVPRMTTTQREAITDPATGLIVYDNTLNAFWYYEGAEWKNIAPTALRTTSAGTILIGEGTGAAAVDVGHTIAIGNNALSSISTGGNNFSVAIGWNSLAVTKNDFTNSTSNPNTVVNGVNLGVANTAVGHRTLSRNTDGVYNVATGYQALLNNSTGSDLTALGTFSLYSNTTGNGNTAVGLQSMERNIGGNKNTSIGLRSGYQNRTGNGNTSLGYLAGSTGPTNENCTFVGMEADIDQSSASYTNSTAVGYQATITADNQVRIGNADVASIGGQVGWSTLSDGRYKVNVTEDVPGLDFIMRLRPVTYNVDKSKLSKKFNNTDGSVSSKVETGFIAQEVEKAAQDSAFEFDAVNPPQNKDDYYTLSYAKMVVPLTKAVQELQLLIDRQTREIASLKAEVETLKNKDGRSMKADAENTTASLD